MVVLRLGFVDPILQIGQNRSHLLDDHLVRLDEQFQIVDLIVMTLPVQASLSMLNRVAEVGAAVNSGKT